MTVMLMLFAADISAQEARSTPQSDPPSMPSDSSRVGDAKDGLEISGLILDQTRTKWGREFHDHLYSRWQSLSVAPDLRFNIIVNEQIRPLLRIWIQVVVNDSAVFEQYVIPRSDIIEQAAEGALAGVRQYLNRQNEDIQQLDGQDLTGDGIY
ncbi:MAG: hypothetical protein HOH43_18775 [Candidatus Latescibacteria bacterium]|nr:hypothetical protein [Candidatus Latescibacterota bacterium]